MMNESQIVQLAKKKKKKIYIYIYIFYIGIEGL